MPDHPVAVMKLLLLEAEAGMPPIDGIHPAGALAVGKLAEGIFVAGSVYRFHIVLLRADAADTRVAGSLDPKVVDRRAFFHVIGRGGNPGHVIGHVFLFAQIHVLVRFPGADETEGNLDLAFIVAATGAASAAGARGFPLCVEVGGQTGGHALILRAAVGLVEPADKAVIIPRGLGQGLAIFSLGIGFRFAVRDPIGLAALQMEDDGHQVFVRVFLALGEAHIGHVVEGVLFVHEAVIGHEAVGRLLRRHLVHAAAHQMAEAAGLFIPIAQEVREKAVAVLHEFRICVRVAAQAAEGNHDPGIRFHVAEAAVAVLRLGEEGQRIVHHGLHLGIGHAAAQGAQLGGIQVVRRQGIDGCGGHVVISEAVGKAPGVVAADGPGPVGLLVSQQGGDQARPERFALGVVQIIMGIYRQEGEGGAVVALPLGLVCAVRLLVQKGLHQVIGPFVRLKGGSVHAHAGQGQDHAGILRIIPFRQHALAAVHILLQVFQISVVPAGLGDAAPVQGKDRPFAEGGAHRRIRHLGGQVSLRAVHGNDVIRGLLLVGEDGEGGVSGAALHPVVVVILIGGRQLNLPDAELVIARRRLCGYRDRQGHQVRHGYILAVEPADDAGVQGIMLVLFEGDPGGGAFHPRQGPAFGQVRLQVEAVDLHSLR